MTEEKVHKAVQQFKLQLNGALSVFNMYGLGEQLPYAKEMITELALQLHKRLNGEDHPIDINHAEKRYRERKNGR